jgi:Sigma-70 region 2
MEKPAIVGRDDPLLEADRPADDAALIARSRAEPEAFAAIFDRHATEIHRYASRRLGSALAEDVVGETFLTAFRLRDRYDVTYRPTMWSAGSPQPVSTAARSRAALAVTSYLRAWIYQHPDDGGAKSDEHGQRRRPARGRQPPAGYPAVSGGRTRGRRELLTS